MPSTSLDITYDITENGVLINDLSAAGNVKAMGTPHVFVRAFLRGLIEEFQNEATQITVNTTCMSHIDPLEAVGFTIDESESKAHFVTAHYEFNDHTDNHTSLSQFTSNSETHNSH